MAMLLGQGAGLTLRSNPQVALSNFEAYSDTLEQLEEEAILRSELLELQGENSGRGTEPPLPVRERARPQSRQHRITC